MAEKQSNNPIVNAIAQAEEPFTAIVKDGNVGLTFKREAMFVKQIIMGSAYLMGCEPQSVFQAILDAATVGITLNPALQHACLVPRNVKTGDKQWVRRAFFTPMYRGLVNLAVEDGTILAVEADVVYQADKEKGVWLFKRGVTPVLEHTPHFGADRTASEFLGVWTKAIASSLGPTYPLIDFMPAEDVYKARDSSEAYRDKDGKLEADAPWVRWFGEQAKKTALKRTQKLWPHNPSSSHRFAKAVMMDDRANHAGITVEGETDEVILLSHDQSNLLNDLLKQAQLRPENFCQAYGIDKISELPAEKYGEVEERLKKRAAGFAAQVAEQPQASPPPREPGSDDDHAEFLKGMDEASED